MLIEANILDCELPLLMSKPALKKAGAILDFQNDVMIIDGEKIGLIDTKSGHYGIPICDKRKLVSENKGIKKPELTLKVSDEMLLELDNVEMKKRALKLHQQFSHVPAYKLQAVLKTSGFDRQDFLKCWRRCVIIVNCV